MICSTMQNSRLSRRNIYKLVALFVRYNAYKTLSVYLIYGYFKTLENTVILGSNFENPCSRQAKVTEIDVVELSNVRRHIFVLTSNGFIIYEYQDGPMPDLSSIRKEFFTNLINYLIINGLTNLLDLQVLINSIDKSMQELILD